jgi:TRAP-type C4-dicarboxylate transport system permease large subunit
MGYLLLAIIFVLLALALAVGAVRLLTRDHWFLGWLRGMLGLTLLTGVLLLSLMAVDVYSYRQLATEQNIATISFKQLESQQYSATFVENNGQQQNFQLYEIGRAHV